jgi:hypothetical protein
MNFFWCDMCLCYSCRYRGSCAEQMTDICTEDGQYLKAECENWREKE